MAVHAITRPICASCRKEAVERHPLIDFNGRSLGMVCSGCLPSHQGRVEVIFHAFGGVHEYERMMVPKEPYYQPAILSLDELLNVSDDMVRRNPELERYLAKA